MRGTRLFFAGCLLLSAVCVALAWGAALPARAMPPQAAAGMQVWRDNACEACHTLIGQGGPYAPDLTHIYVQRGADYLREFLTNPGAFHPGQRVMPRFDLTRDDIENLFAFLEWVGQQSPTWPPQPILVAGGANPAVSFAPVSSTADPVEADSPAMRGAALFRTPPAICGTCHALQADVVIVGPSLAGVASRAGSRVPGQSAEDYLRESIVNPGDYVVPGFQDVMQKNFGSVLTSDQINDLIAYLMTLR
ncbi:MAG: c-type cytochrome [Anaerolineae bacterium]|nr:c-type cytochrome [Anaerolineae bacterium]